MGLRYRRLSPACGTEITGLDLTQPVGENLFRELNDAWLAADGVLVLRDQDITPQQHIDFSRNFGTLFAGDPDSMLGRYYLPGRPEIYRVSNKKIDGVAQGREDAGTYWHSDSSWQTEPSKASLLHALEIPPAGGDTMFADMYRAYDALSDRMKSFLDGLDAMHDRAAAAATSYAKEFGMNQAELAGSKALHPIVRTHPESGRKALFVNRGFTSHIPDLSPTESDAVLQLLFAHCTTPGMVYRHQWRLKDLVIWDNRCTMHFAVSDYKALGDRYMHRTTVMGDRPH